MAFVEGQSTPLREISGADPDHPTTRAFLRELRALGYVEGRNLILDRRSAEGHPERYAQIVDELLRLKPDVITMPGMPSLVRLAKDAPNRVPTVVYSLVSPVKLGLVESLARPGGNITGGTIDVGPEIEAKRLELLKEAIPTASRVVFLAPEGIPPPISAAVVEAAKSLGLELVKVTHDPASINPALAEIRLQRPDALFASLSSATYGHRREIVRFALDTRLPGSYPYAEMAAGGGLMSYGVDVEDLLRRGARYVDKVLKGAKPADLPIEQPTKFELIVNLKTARAIGVRIPPSILLRAHRVIE
ncbi:MAG: ABC transporter substrate-binding protein [Pseudomonadota bacterium]